MDPMGAYSAVFTVRMIAERNDALDRASLQARAGRPGIARRIAQAIAGTHRSTPSGGVTIERTRTNPAAVA